MCIRDSVCTVFSHTLPQGKEEVCRVFVLEQKINLINEDKGILTLCTVLCDTVQDRVKDNKHTNRHKLFTQVKNVIAAVSYTHLLCFMEVFALTASQVYL